MTKDYESEQYWEELRKQYDAEQAYLESIHWDCDMCKGGNLCYGCSKWEEEMGEDL